MKRNALPSLPQLQRGITHPALLAITLLVILVAMTSLACRPGTDTKAPEASEEATTPRRGGTLRTTSQSDVSGFNPITAPPSRHNVDIANLLYLHLVDEQPDSTEHQPTFRPAVAESWTWSDDGLSLTFKIRPGLLWSDGVPVTAEDLRFSWQAQSSAEVAWRGAESVANVRDVEVIDERTATYHFDEVNWTSLNQINEGWVLPKHSWGKLPFSEWRSNSDFFRENLVVNGPFELESWTAQQETILRRNENYFDSERPYLDRIVFSVLPDASTQILQLKTGELDIVEQIPVSAVTEIEANPNLDLVSFWHRVVVFIAWNMRQAPFDQIEVRQAVTLALDRDAIVEALWGQFGRVAVSPFVRNVWVRDPTLEPWPFDPQRAKELLAQAGYRDSDNDGILDKDGEKLKFNLLSHQGNQERQRAAVMIQEQLRLVGIEVEVRTIEWNTLIERVYAHDFEGAMMAWSMPTTFDLTFGFASESADDGDNLMGYQDAETDRLLAAHQQAKDYATAGPILHSIERQIHQVQPMTFLWESQRMLGKNKRVRGMQPNLLGVFWHLEDVWLAGDAPQ